MVRQHQGYSPGTATGRPYGVRGIIGSTEVESVGRRGHDPALQSFFIVHYSSFIIHSPAGCGRSLDWCGIGLTDLLSIGLAPAFLIRRFAPPCPFAVPCGHLAAEAAALPTDRCTRLCSASSATGSAEQRGPRGKAFRGAHCPLSIIHYPLKKACFFSTPFFIYFTGEAERRVTSW